ncbi:MAG: hypothetical protein ACI8T1_002754 [Verrucomicrobiales bacterium]|jgi:hypothetical protein
MNPTRILTLLVSLFCAATASAQFMNYQGLLTDTGGNPLDDGQYTVTFNIYNGPNAGAALIWGPFAFDGNPRSKVNLAGGRFNVVLGTLGDPGLTNAFVGGAPRFLGITVGSNPEILPRQQMLAAPTALHALKADLATTATNATNAGHATTAGSAATVTSVVLKTDEGNQRVGVGTATPGAKLDVIGDVNSNNVLRLNKTLGSNSPANIQHGLHFEIQGVGAKALGIGVLDNGSCMIQGKETGIGYLPLLLNPVAGNVGIGISTPTQAKLVVGSGFSAWTGNTRYFDYSATLFENASNATYANISILATNDIHTTVFRAYSDARIKTIEGRSDSVADLAILTQLEIADYRYKDVVNKGNSPHKKVIAQQVETVFPQAVTLTTDVVPDIYQNATIKDGWVNLTTELKKGERVRLIGEKTESIHEVLEVKEGQFRTDFEADSDKVFVFGREVDDFRSVDYEAIAMLNVSATQELHRRLETQEAALASKTAEISALKERLEGFDQKFAKLERLLDGRSEVIPVSID